LQVIARYYGFFSTVTGKLSEEIKATGLNDGDTISFGPIGGAA